MDEMTDDDDGWEPANLSLVFTMEEEDPPDGEEPIRYKLYRFVPDARTPMACLVEEEGDETSFMVVPVELLQAAVAALANPEFD